MKRVSFFKLSLVVFVLVVGFVLPANASNLSISNVTFDSRNPSSSTVVLSLDLSWDNSWKTKVNHDAVWLTVRLYNPSVSPTDKKLCKVTQSGLDPVGTSAGSNNALEVYVPQDKMGVFVRPSGYGVESSVLSEDVSLTIDYASCGFSSSDNVSATVFGLEMVYVPTGAFYAGDYATATAALVQGSSDTDPWYVDSEGDLSVSNPTSSGYRYVSAGNAGESSTGASFTIDADFPKGYGAFYAMKYEITEGQWVEFVNSLGSSSQRAARDITNATHKNSDSVQYRNTISCSGSPLTCSTNRPYRAVGYLTWMDLASFLDFMALRPMSELEYEKAARGPLMAVSGEMAWGNSSATEAAVISGSDENGSEVVSTTGANVNFNNTTFSGGDSSNGAAYTQGPLRSGVFASSASDRPSSGAGYYGLMELSGNVSERVVTIGNADGLNFSGTHGDGVLTTQSGYEGNATNTDWPGIDGVPARGITGATGSGFHGGGWGDQASGAALRISDRSNAANANTASFSDAGGRGVRTYDGQ